MSSSSLPPHVPAKRFRAFYEHPAPVMFDAVLPDDLDGPEDERQFLLDEAPFSRGKAIRVVPVYGDGTVPPPSSPASGRSPLPEGDGTPWERRGSVRASLVADLTAAMGKDPITPFDVEAWKVEALADRLVRAGWRRVTEDPGAVLDDIADQLDRQAEERLARSEGECPCEDECEEITCHTVAAVVTWKRAAGLVRRRAAVLRGGAR